MHQQEENNILAKNDNDPHSPTPDSAPIVPATKAGEVTFRPVQFAEMEYENGDRINYLSQTGAPLEPGEAVMEYYRQQGHQGIWAGNDFWWQVMTLLFWDVIYAKLEGGFIPMTSRPELEEFPNVYQNAPNDLKSRDFYIRRKDLIKSRMAKLSKMKSLGKTIRHSRRQHYGVSCYLIENWDKYSADELCEGLAALRVDQVLRIIERLLTNFRDHCMGMPGFIFVSPKPLFVAMKTKHETLTMEQMQWQKYLAEDVGVPMEVLLINHSDDAIKQLELKASGKQHEITVTFGPLKPTKSTGAVEFAKTLSHYSEEGSGLEITHKVTIHASEIEALFELLLLTKKWPDRTIAAGGEPISENDLRNALKCYQKKISENKSDDYCLEQEWDENQNNFFGCRQIHFQEFEDERWTRFGYMNITTSQWNFNKSAIREHMDQIVDQHQLCPLFNEETTYLKLETLLKKLPGVIDPETNNDWGFLDTMHNLWFYDNHDWCQEWGMKKWPGVSHIIGVRKINSSQRKNARSRKSSQGKTQTKKAVAKKAVQTGCLLPVLFTFAVLFTLFGLILF